MPSQSTHEEAELENDIVTRRSVFLRSLLGRVVWLCYRNRKVRFVKRPFKAFNRIIHCAEYSVRPHCHRERIVSETVLNPSRDLKGLLMR